MTGLDPRIVELLLERAADPEAFEQWRQRGQKTGWCRHPVRLVGSSVTADASTGEVHSTFSSDALPDHTLFKACGQRRATACPTCSATYRTDAFHLVAAGLRGGKGVPETIAEHPVVFATLTAPSFGAVHSRRLDQATPRACHPEPACRHGRRCPTIHLAGEPDLGQPLCPSCFDYPAAVLWNALASDLWRRTTIEIRRSLARSAGITEKALRERLRLSYTKVVEYQQRGSVHLHAVIRLDQPDNDLPPEPPFDAVLLAASVWQAARAVRAPQPTGSPIQGDARWGQQLDVHDLSRTGPGVAAAYLAKYATKSTDPAGHLDHRLRAGDLARLDQLLTPHLAAMVRTAWDLGADPNLKHLGLRRWAHTLGFRGHWLTKSRAYSTTFTALRGARRSWHDESAEPSLAVAEFADWTFAGRGWLSPADAILANTAASDGATARRTAWEERGRRGR
jgi:hypothetical protein